MSTSVLTGPTSRCHFVLLFIQMLSKGRTSRGRTCLTRFSTRLQSNLQLVGSEISRVLVATIGKGKGKGLRTCSCILHRDHHLKEILRSLVSKCTVVYVLPNVSLSLTCCKLDN